MDFVAPAGTAVRAANAGTVTFAGSVAGTLHVVVAHQGGLRTSASFLATVTVRRGQRVAHGDVIGTTGNGPDEHVGVLHFGLRVGDRYVDPMVLFVPSDLTRLIRLVAVDLPEQAGFDPPAIERRSLAESLHLPSGVTGLLDPPRGEGGWDAIGDAFDALASVAAIVGGPIGADSVAVAGRLLTWARSRQDCDSESRQPSNGGGSGHLALTIAGINSATDRATGVALPLDTGRLGYREGEVHSFSYAPDGGPYDKADTAADLRKAARALGRQLRALERREPGREVDLIAHSQGGVVVAEFLAHGYDASDATLPPLGSVVTLSSPLQGAPLATAVKRVRATASGRVLADSVDAHSAGVAPPTGGTSTRQLAEDSGFMRRLERAPLPEQIDVTSIGATDDLVVPADHTTRPDVRSLTVNPSGFADHSAIVRDPGALDAARLALEGRSMPCVGVAAGVRGAVEPVLISRAEHTVGEVGGALGATADALFDIGGTP